MNDGDVDALAAGLGQESFDDLRFEIEEVIDAGDEVVVMASVHGVGTDSGVPVKSPSSSHIWTFENGRPVRMRDAEQGSGGCSPPAPRVSPVSGILRAV